MKTPIVYLVGAGPGDPGLITIKGRECIARADVVIYDYLAAPALLRHASPGAELVYVGKQGGDKVYAATVNGEALLKCRATGVGSHTLLAGIIRLIVLAVAGLFLAPAMLGELANAVVLPPEPTYIEIES